MLDDVIDDVIDETRMSERKRKIFDASVGMGSGITMLKTFNILKCW